jgi:uncharacterized membrane protein YqjE
MTAIDRNRLVRILITLVALLVIGLIAAIVLLPDRMARIAEIFLR